MCANPTNINIDKLNYLESIINNQPNLVKNVVVRKPYKDCKKFSFKAKTKEEIKKILSYFRDRDTDLLCKLPEDLLQEAK